jgi:glycosyltransferase involved in cell wall biosynthesis
MIPPADAEALADAIRRLTSDPALARSVGDGGPDVYREKAGEDVLGARWRSVLERAA